MTVTQLLYVFDDKSIKIGDKLAVTAAVNFRHNHVPNTPLLIFQKIATVSGESLPTMTQVYLNYSQGRIWALRTLGG